MYTSSQSSAGQYREILHESYFYLNIIEVGNKSRIVDKQIPLQGPTERQGRLRVGMVMVMVSHGARRGEGVLSR